MSSVETELSLKDHVEPFMNEKCREVTHSFSGLKKQPVHCSRSKAILINLSMPICESIYIHIYIYIPSYKKRSSRFKINDVMQLWEAALFSTEI